MKLAGMELGLLMNFNVTELKDGIQRFVLWILRALRVFRGEMMDGDLWAVRRAVERPWRPKR